MRAMVLDVPRPIEQRPLQAMDLPRPQAGPRDIVLRMRACGICHTDLHIVEGELPLHRQPLIPGHQIVGEVVERGTEARRSELGQRVGVAWLHETCGVCAHCTAGCENLCPAGRFTGWDADGGYAEYARVPEDFAYALPDGVTNEAAAPLLCAGIIGYRALRLSGARSEQRVGLFGFGASAHIAIQVARHWDCTVYVFTRSAAHQALALELGATWVGNPVDQPPEALQAAVMFAPAGPLVPAALRVLAPGATLALAGIYMSPIPQLDYNTELYQERVLRSVTNATRQDGRELLELAARIPIRTRTRRFRLDEANEALLALKRSEIDGAGVLHIA